MPDARKRRRMEAGVKRERKFGGNKKLIKF
jgi:hypothetical protein